MNKEIIKTQIEIRWLCFLLFIYGLALFVIDITSIFITFMEAANSKSGIILITFTNILIGIISLLFFVLIVYVIDKKMKKLSSFYGVSFWRLKAKQIFGY